MTKCGAGRRQTRKTISAQLKQYIISGSLVPDTPNTPDRTFFPLGWAGPSRVPESRFRSAIDSGLIFWAN